MRRNSLIRDDIEGEMTEIKGLGSRKTQLLDDLRNRSIHLDIKEEVKDRKTWKAAYFIFFKYAAYWQVHGVIEDSLF